MYKFVRCTSVYYSPMPHDNPNVGSMSWTPMPHMTDRLTNGSISWTFHILCAQPPKEMCG
eukprot:m.375069 g.375069  ORF g.375069 m.375069 type:complete len:60 (-) comp20913_c0_seq1:1761-1940(-)